MYELSSIDSLGKLQNADARTTEILDGISNNLRTHYFDQLVFLGYHIIYTVPLWAGNPVPVSTKLTDFIVQTSSEVAYDRTNIRQATPLTEPILLILGTTGSRKIKASTAHSPSGLLIRPVRGLPYGTTFLPARIFLQEHLIGLLERVNAMTTLVILPFPPRRYGLRPQISLWERSENTKEDECKWLFVSDVNNTLKYEWSHFEEYSRKYVGNDQDRGVLPSFNSQHIVESTFHVSMNASDSQSYRLQQPPIIIVTFLPFPSAVSLTSRFAGRPLSRLASFVPPR